MGLLGQVHAERWQGRGRGASGPDHTLFLSDGLDAVVLQLLPSQGTYFITMDIAGVLPQGSTEDDVAVSVCPRTACMWATPRGTAPAGPPARRRHLFCQARHAADRAHAPPCPQFCKRLTEDGGVTLIPVSAFYSDRCVAQGVRGFGTRVAVLLWWWGSRSGRAWWWPSPARGPAPTGTEVAARSAEHRRGWPTLPPSHRSAAPTNLVRLVICKTDAKLEAALGKLEAYLKH